MSTAFGATDKYIVFEGTYSGNFNKNVVEVYRYNSYTDKWKLYSIPRKLVPKSFKISKGKILRFEIKESTFKALKFRKVAGFMK